MKTERSFFYLIIRMTSTDRLKLNDITVVSNIKNFWMRRDICYSILFAPSFASQGLHFKPLLFIIVVNASCFRRRKWCYGIISKYTYRMFTAFLIFNLGENFKRFVLLPFHQRMVCHFLKVIFWRDCIFEYLSELNHFGVITFLTCF